MCLATFEAMDALVGAVGTQKLTLDTCNDLGSALQTAALHGPAALARSPVLRSLLSQLMLRMVQVSAGSMPAGLPFSSQEGAGRQAGSRQLEVLLHTVEHYLAGQFTASYLAGYHVAKAAFGLDWRAGGANCSHFLPLGMPATPDVRGPGGRGYAGAGIRPARARGRGRQ